MSLRAAATLAFLTALVPLSSPAQVPRFTPTEVVVILASPSGSGPLAPRSSEALALPELARAHGVPARDARPVLAHATSRRAFSGEAWVLTLDPGVDPALAAAALATDPRVLYAGLNHLLSFEQTFPDDPLVNNQYALFQTRAFDAWEISDGSGVLIAIIDSGAELDHPDLVNQIARNSAEADGVTGQDDDGNGYIDDVFGYDFTDVPGWPGVGDYLDRDADPTDDLGHGTQVAGVAAAQRNNGIGMAGMAPGAKLLPVRAGFRTGLPFVGGLLQEDDAAAAIIYAADRGAQVINLSFGSTEEVPLIRHAVRYAQAQGALVVASAGNTGRDAAHYPSAYPGVLAPGASSREEIRAGFSTYGQDLDLLAPGLGLYSTSLGGDYSLATGTSFSAPMTAGAAALVWSRYPTWSAGQVAWRLRLSARRTDPGWTPAWGWGLLDADRALADDRPPPVVEVTAQHPTSDRGFRLEGTVADPDLLLWSLSAVPDSAAVAFGGAGPVPGERVLADRLTRQAVAESLATFSPGIADTGIWVFRLEAELRGDIVLEERSRALLSSPVITAEDLHLEPQADQTGWSLAGWWRSSERHQGALRLVGPGLLGHQRQEPSVSTHHAVRLLDPLPEGTWTVEVLARVRESDAYTAVASQEVVVPPMIVPLLAQAREEAVPGTPMPRALDQDGNGAQEIYVEAPPGSGNYGPIHSLEFENSTFTEWGSSEGLFEGIPVDAADADGDGKLELAVFRLDRWKVWEAIVVKGFPQREIHDEYLGRSLPARYVTTPTGIRLLAVAGSTVRVFRSDPADGYVLEAEVATGGPALTARVVTGDFDADGWEEAAFLDQAGSLVMIELGAGDPSLDHRVSPVFPVVAFGVHRGPGGDDLLTLDRDPSSLDAENDLDRAATRLRRWHWNGTQFTETGALALAGMSSPSDLQIVEGGPEVLVRRGKSFDRIGCPDDGSVNWMGRVHNAGLPRVDGAVWVDEPGAASRVYLGGISAAGTAESFALVSRDPPREGTPLEVLTATLGNDHIDLELGWEPGACGMSTLVLREGDVLGSFGIPVRGNRASDVVAPGENVLYRLVRSECAQVQLQIVDAHIDSLLPYWSGDDLRVEFPTPLRGDAALAVQFRAGDLLVPAAGVVRAAEDHALWIVPPAVAAESLIVTGALLTSGLPLGGARRASVWLPARPTALRPPVLAAVSYRPQGPDLEVTLAGDSLDCDAVFRLEPGGVVLPTARRGGTIPLDLPAPLAKGMYSLRLDAPCTDSTAVGLTRSFGVGQLLYPNPVGPGEQLVLENLEPGTRIAILDVRGEERLSWIAAAPAERLALDSLAPGIYLVRFEAPDGTALAVEKLAVIR